MLYFQENAGLLRQHFKPKSQMQTVSKVGVMKSEVARAASKVGASGLPGASLKP